MDRITDEATLLEADLVRAAIFPVMLTGAIVIWRRGRFVVGRLLILIGTLHLLGLWVGREPIARMAQHLFFGQADSAVGNLPAYADQELVFWFALWGVWTMFVGELTIVAERAGVQLPSRFGWQLLIVNLVCALLMPRGGFWWVLLPAWLIIRGRAPGSSAPDRA